MIKPVPRHPQHTPIPASSAQGKEKTGKVEKSTASMQDTASTIKQLASHLPFGAGGRHTFTESPTDSDLAKLTDEVAGNQL